MRAAQSPRRPAAILGVEPKSTPSESLPLVVFIGFEKPLSKVMLGLLTRCGLSVMESESPEQAISVLTVLTADAIVLDSRHAELRRASESMSVLLKQHLNPCEGRPFAAVVVVHAHGLRPDVRAAYLKAGAVIRSQPQTARQLVRLLRGLCGLTEPCCD